MKADEFDRKFDDGDMIGGWVAAPAPGPGTSGRRWRRIGVRY